MTVISLIGQVAMANLFYFCLPLCRTSFIYLTGNSSYFRQNEVFMTPHKASIEKYRPDDRTAEALRDIDVGCSAEVHRHRVTSYGVLALLYRPYSYKQLTCSQLEKCQCAARQK